MLSRIQIMKDLHQPKVSPISKDDQVASNVSVFSVLFFSFLFYFGIKSWFQVKKSIATAVSYSLIFISDYYYVTRISVLILSPNHILIKQIVYLKSISICENYKAKQRVWSSIFLPCLISGKKTEIQWVLTTLVVNFPFLPWHSKSKPNGISFFQCNKEKKNSEIQLGFEWLTSNNKISNSKSLNAETLPNICPKMN